MKTLILTASYGGGHNAAAKDIQEKFLEQNHDTNIVDFVEELGKEGSKTKNFHENVLAEKLKFLWKIAFKVSDYSLVNKFIQKRLNGRYRSKFEKVIEESKADIIILTNPLWLAFLKEQAGCKTAVVVTDAIKIHSFWYKKFIDHYFLIDKFSKEQFIEKFEHNPKNVHTTFFPMNEKWFIEKEKISNKKIYFLLDSQKYKFSNKFLKLLDSKDFCEQVVVIRHRNQKVYDKLQENTRSDKIQFKEFVNLKENYSNIDIFVGKPGGAVVTECIATSTPIIVTTYIPGQEEGNIQLMKNLGIGFYSKDAKHIVERLENKDWNETITSFEETKNPKVLEDIYKILTSD